MSEDGRVTLTSVALRLCGVGRPDARGDDWAQRPRRIPFRHVMAKGAGPRPRIGVAQARPQAPVTFHPLQELRAGETGLSAAAFRICSPANQPMALSRLLLRRLACHRHRLQRTRRRPDRLPCRSVPPVTTLIAASPDPWIARPIIIPRSLRNIGMVPPRATRCSRPSPLSERVARQWTSTMQAARTRAVRSGRRRLREPRSARVHDPFHVYRTPELRYSPRRNRVPARRRAREDRRPAGSRLHRLAAHEDVLRAA